MRRLTCLAAVVLAALVAVPAAGATNPLTAFTLVVPRATASSGLQARALLPVGARCPALRVSVVHAGTQQERLLPMSARRAAPSTGAAFASVFVCQAAIPAGAVAAAVGATTIPAALPDTIETVALLGDTGCAIMQGEPTQVCSSASKWPIARVASSIARANPDVIMHLGDYLYREAACPSDLLARCGGSPAPVPGKAFVDTDYGWVADAIIPLSPLFAVAPIVMTRGNHEDCNQGGNGWYLFFDPWAGSARHCAPNAQGEVPEAVSKTWTAELPLGAKRTLHIAVVDSAYGDDVAVSSWKAHADPLYRAAALESATTPGRESWLITHRPLFGINEWLLPSGDPYATWISADQTAAALPNLDPFSLILGSHIHVAQANQVPGMPGQLVIGNSGTLLEPSGGFTLPVFGPLRSQQTGASMLSGVTLPGNATSTWSASRFGFVIAKPGAAAGQWSFSQRSPNGVEFARCTLARREISCG